MNIKKFLQKSIEEEKKVIYASSIRRSCASAIDAILALILRAITIQIIGMLYLERVWRNFFTDLNNTFGTSSLKRTPEHLNFLIHHQIFFITIISIVIIILVGAIYYAVLNSSYWQATVGKRIMNIMMIQEPNDSRITITTGLWHYFLALFPFVFVLYLMNYQINHKLDFFHVITANNYHLFFGFLFVIWLNVHLITKKKTTTYDLICKTVLINGRTKAKFPWSKI
ncbi:MAG: RDD family protein [Rickettsiales bacterium]|nr:RDD family protein [Rickettsiales bacterium]